jgi:hypothetical protein
MIGLGMMFKHTSYNTGGSAVTLIAFVLIYFAFCRLGGGAHGAEAGSGEGHLFSQQGIRLSDALDACKQRATGFKINQGISVDIVNDICNVHFNAFKESTLACEFSSFANNTGCLAAFIEKAFDVKIGEGSSVGPSCEEKLVCTRYFDFYDKENNFQKQNVLCGFHIGGVAKVDQQAKIVYLPSISFTTGCFKESEQ